MDCQPRNVGIVPALSSLQHAKMEGGAVHDKNGKQTSEHDGDGKLPEGHEYAIQCRRHKTMFKDSNHTKAWIKFKQHKIAIQKKEAEE